MNTDDLDQLRAIAPQRHETSPLFSTAERQVLLAEATSGTGSRSRGPRTARRPVRVWTYRLIPLAAAGIAVAVAVTAGPATPKGHSHSAAAAGEAGSARQDRRLHHAARSRGRRRAAQGDAPGDDGRQVRPLARCPGPEQRREPGKRSAGRTARSSSTTPPPGTAGPGPSRSLTTPTGPGGPSRGLCPAWPATSARTASVSNWSPGHLSGSVRTPFTARQPSTCAP